MKKMRLFILAIVLMAICLGIAGCSQGTAPAPSDKPTSTEAKTVDKYAYHTHNNGYYTVEGKVTLQGDKIVAAQIDELNSPISWGQFSQNKITDQEKAALGDENILTGLAQLHGDPAENQFAKYIQVGDVVFTAVLKPDGFVTYSAEGIDDIVKYFDTDEANIGWYFEQMRAGNYWILKKSGDSFEKVDISRFTTKANGKDPLAKGESQSKRLCQHWDNWMPNIKKTEDFFLKHGVIEGEIKQTSDGAWAVADTVSGATATEFPNYLGILYDAYKK
ncbi:hypothetical protein OXPF_25160 [Oxobacter pfennigii]|uniref:Lipoprotein n=1 Tax=Oxobacter pfennigii TaxID=36849 RepID=A0A0P8W8L1_9CLOT|nr:hypothetical protein [Oxobacter pfennigii]KPU44346.1 hypothetical protein OXPF_25160 [Oxobacter pfennigii]